MNDLEPVEGNPFETAPDTLEPVEGNPFTKPPGAVMDRVNQGTYIDKQFAAIGGAIKEGFGSEPLGFSPENEQELRKMGMWHDPANGTPGPLRSLNEAIMKPAAAVADGFFRAISGGVHGIGETIKQGYIELGGNESWADRAKKEAINAMNWAMQRGDMNITHSAKRSPIEQGGDVQVGRLPAPPEFHDAAMVISDGQPHAGLADNLNRLYAERGLHPAEVAADAAESPRLRQELLSDSGGVPEPYAQLTLNDGTPNPNVAPDMHLLSDGIRYDQIEPVRTAKSLPGHIATRVMPDGRVVPAPSAVADYLKAWGEKAGFKFTIGPEMKEMYEKNGPQYQRGVEFDRTTGEQKTYASVYMPDTADAIYRRWYGLGTAEILYHEVGHALDYHVLRKDEYSFLGESKREITDPELKAEMEAASRRFRPKLWDMNPAYNSKPTELFADAVATYLSNPTERKNMPLFEAKYGAKLKEYLDISARYLPERTENGTWEQPRTEAGKGGGGEPPGGSPPGGPEPVFEHEPRMIEGPRMPPEEAQRRILDHLSIDKDADTSKKWTWSRFYTNMVDKFHPIFGAVKDALGVGEELAAKDDPYKLARMFAGWSGKANHFLEKGAVGFHDYKTLGPALKEILAPFKQDLNGFRAFVTAARAKELEVRGIVTGFDPKAVQAFVTPENIAKYAPAMEKLVKYQNSLADYLHDSGVIGTEARDAMFAANRLFVPFHVAIDHANIKIEQVGGALQAHNPIKRIEGSETPKIDPLESIVKNTYVLTAMAEKNVVASKLIDLLTGGDKKAGQELVVSHGPQIGGPERGGSKAVGKYLGEEGMDAKHADVLGDVLTELGRKDKDGEISRFVDGRRETYRVDSDLANAMKGLNAEAIGMLEKLMQPFASTLRAGAVLTPDFMARHTFRDFIYAFVTTTKGVFTPVDLARGFAGIITRDKDFWNWQLGGGGGVSMVHLDRNYLQEDLRKLTGQTGLFTRAWNVVVDPSSSLVDKAGAVAGTPFKAVGRYVIHPLQLGTELVISASHLAAYKKTARYLNKNEPNAGNKENILEAAWSSRHVSVDGARIGAQMKAYNMISAFANNKIQDTDRIVRALKDNPVNSGLKIFAGITAPSLILWAVNHQDSRYQELPQWEKDVFWHVITDKWENATPQEAQTRLLGGRDLVRQVGDQYQVNNGHIFRLPKPFGAGVIFGSGPERLMEKFYAEKPDAFKHFFGAVMEATVGELLPNMLAPVVDQAQNRVTFTGRTLIPAQQEKLLPEYQYSEYTTETAKAIGKTISEFPGFSDRADRASVGTGGAQRALTSPILIENYVRAWTGGLGKYALDAADYGLRKAGVLPDPVRPTSTLADVPVVRAFISRYPSAGTESIQNFFDRYDKQKTFYDTWMAKAKEGDQVAVERIQRLGGESTFLKLDGIKAALNAQSKVLHMVNKNPNIDPAQKRQLIDGLYYGMISVGKQGVADMRNIDAALK